MEVDGPPAGRACLRGSALNPGQGPGHGPHALLAQLRSSANTRPMLNSVEIEELPSKLWIKVPKDAERWVRWTGSTV